MAKEETNDGDLSKGDIDKKLQKHLDDFEKFIADEQPLEDAQKHIDEINKMLDAEDAYEKAAKKLIDEGEELLKKFEEIDNPNKSSEKDDKNDKDKDAKEPHEILFRVSEPEVKKDKEGDDKKDKEPEVGKIEYSIDGKTWTEVPYDTEIDKKTGNIIFKRDANRKKPDGYTKRFEAALQGSSLGLGNNYKFDEKTELTVDNGSDKIVLDGKYKSKLENSKNIVAAAKEHNPKKGMSMTGNIVTTVGVVGLIAVAWNRFKAMFTGQPQTEEEIENGEEVKPKSLFSKITNGLAGIAAAVVGTALINDVAKGNELGDTLGKWAKMVTDRKNNSPNQGTQIT